MYQIFKGYETYLTGYILRQTRIKQEMQLERMKLPDNHVYYILPAPEGKHIVLDISLEKEQEGEAIERIGLMNLNSNMN